MKDDFDIKQIGAFKSKYILKLLEEKFYSNHFLCEAFPKGKQLKSSFKPKKCVYAFTPLELLCRDLFGPARTLNLGGKQYRLVIINDYSKYSWIFFLAQKEYYSKSE